MKIAPSILAADFGRLAEHVRQAEAGGANRVHVDVMDGHFVPNLSMGAVAVKGLRPYTKLPLEVHLMVEKPAMFFDGFLKAGADSFIFHLEVEPEPLDLIQQVRSLGKKVGLAVNPDFPIEKLEPWIADIDLALIMTVFPGFGGQPYLVECNDRIRQTRLWIRELNPKCELEVDGGVDARTIRAAALAGADVFVAGTSVFGTPDPAEAVRELSRIAEG
jgi:ribulose-phosphate 3-epimerase